jgi:LemA protein
MKIKAKNYLDALQQKIQANASTIDNYMENRVVILTNAAKLLDKAIDLDKDVLTKVAAYRGGVNPNNDQIRSEVAGQIDGLARSINVAFEAYPDIKAHKEIAECLQQNAYLQREITSARDLYNASVTQWNQIIFRWPTYKIVAAKAGYTTRIPFTASKAIQDASRSVLF